MRWASALSQDPGTPQAVAEAVAALRRELGGERADLVVAFASPHHRAAAADIPALVAAELPGALLVGCTGGGVIGAGHEVEERAAVSLTAAALPGVEMTPFHLDTTDLPAASAPPPTWHAAIGVAPQARPKFLLLADPLTLDASALLAGLDVAYPRSSKFGGLASGGMAPGANRLFLRDEVFRSGIVGIALSGNLRVETIVAQGCRPIGRPMLVTRCQGNVLFELYRHSLFLGLGCQPKLTLQMAPKVIYRLCEARRRPGGNPSRQVRRPGWRAGRALAAAMGSGRGDESRGWGRVVGSGSDGDLASHDPGWKGGAGER